MRGMSIMRSMVLVQMVAWTVVRGSDPAPPDCAIPDGEFDGIVVGTNKRQPFYGDRCSVSSTIVQVQKKQCMTHYCCEEPCLCGGSNVKPDYTTCVNSTQPKTMLCFVLHMAIEQTLYGCCQGLEEDEFHVCSKAVNCAMNNGGCDQLCLHNNTTGKDYCGCYPGNKRQLINSNGTTQCRGNGTLASSVAATDLPTTTSSPTPSVTSDALGVVSRDFPLPYIIAIVVGSILFLLLLLLLLLLALCYRRYAARRLPSSKVVASMVIGAVIVEKKPVKDIWVKVEDDDEKVKGDTTGRGVDTNLVIENRYSEDPVGNVASKASVYGNKIENNDGYEAIYEEIPENYEDNHANYEEIPANNNSYA